MKKRNVHHLSVQKKTISKLNFSKLNGGNVAPTLDPLNSQCICRTDAYLCLTWDPFCN